MQWTMTVNLRKPIIRALGFGAVVLLAIVVAALLLPSGQRPLCHRAIDGAFQQWMLVSGSTNDYPNDKGSGSNSLATIERYMGHDIYRYGYVPGLRPDDPEDVVLMYVRTRYTWHSDYTHTIFSPELWLVLPPAIRDYEYAGDGFFHQCHYESPARAAKLSRRCSYAGL
jgi:hypothetical protein